MIKSAYVAVSDWLIGILLVCFFTVAEALGGMDDAVDDDYWPPLVLALAIVAVPAVAAIWG